VKRGRKDVTDEPQTPTDEQPDAISTAGLNVPPVIDDLPGAANSADEVAAALDEAADADAERGEPEPASDPATVEEQDRPDLPEEAEPDAPAQTRRGRPVGEPDREPEPVVAEPEPEATQEREPEEARTEPEPAAPMFEGDQQVVYLGPADLFEYGEFKFRPGEPAVTVPSEVAEDLLTYPGARFDVRPVEGAGDDGNGE
jgi:hypothetical protein